MTRDKKMKIALLASMTGLYFFSYFQRVGIPSSIFNELQADLAMSASAVTALSSIYLYVYAGMQLFIGALVDRHGGLRVITVCGVLLVLGSFMFPMSGGTGMLFFSRALIGLGGSAMYLCLVKETDMALGARNFAPALGVIYFTGYSGGLAGTKPFRMLVEFCGWRQSLTLAALCTLAALILVLVFQRMVKSERPEHGGRSMLSSFKKSVSNKLNYVVFICWPVNFAIYFVLQATIGAKFLEDFTGMSSLQASGYTFYMMLLTVALMLTGGFASRLVGNARKPFLLLSSCMTLAGVAALIVGVMTKAPPGLFLAALLAMSVSAGCGGVVVAMLKELNPSDTAVLSIGIQNMLAYAAVALLSNIVGVVLDAFKGGAVVTERTIIYPPSAYMTIFLILAVFAALSLLVSFKARETRGQCVFTKLP